MERTTTNEQGNICALLEKARAGDRDAFKAIVHLYQKKVFLLAYSFLRNREDALDIVQETFMRLYQKFHVFDSEGNFQAWLLRIARNLAIDHYRKYHHQLHEKGVEKRTDQMERASDTNPAPETSSDLRLAFTRCLEKLAPQQKGVFVMKHYNGLRYKEIAQILEISVGTVKSLHFKAVRKMRKLLSLQLGIEP